MSQNGRNTPADGRGRSPAGSRPGSAAPSRSASRARSVAPVDPNLEPSFKAMDPKTGRAPVLLKNVDLGGDAYTNLNDASTKLLQRNDNYGKAGRAAKINVNSYIVETWPTKPIYQYDVLIGSGAEHRGLIKAVWDSKAVKDAVGPGFIFDGNKLGWSMINFDRELRIAVDLNKEKEKPKMKNGKVVDDIHRCVIRNAMDGKAINLQVLKAYLMKQTAFSEEILQCINFFDHLLRETPSKTMINLRRSYFARETDNSDRAILGMGIEAFKGVYQSLRAADGGKLVINADIANSCFWREESFARLARELLGGPPDDMRFKHAATTHYDTLKRLERNKFRVVYPGSKGSSTIHTAMKVSFKTAEKYTFDWRLPDSDKTEHISIQGFFLKKYKIRLAFPWLPVIETGKKGEAYPMEFCIMDKGQKYPYKLNEDQTSRMIKFAVSLPRVRKEAIQKGLSKLGWASDVYLKNYGMKINPNMLETTARVLNPPEVLFKTNTAKPMYSGRWDLRGKQFFAPNPIPLKIWGVCVLTGSEGGRPNGAPNKMQVDAFLTKFIATYRSHGGRIENASPPVVNGIPDTAEAIKETVNQAGRQYQMQPQMIMVILTSKSVDVYRRVKKNLECRWGIVSQCVQASHLIKNADQYISNVLMKFNSKLGGTTSRIKTSKAFFTKPTMILGADVTHSAPGQFQPSVAALTMSIDNACARYAAGVQTNGLRLEMIAPQVMRSMFEPLLNHWITILGQGKLPAHVYYFRDGVSEGQYTPLLQNEVADLRQIFLEKVGGRKELLPRFTVVICEKRHHIRFFPQKGPAADRNDNPVPGTIVDRDVTHPFEQDFYLNAHSAIQGTARPTHYHIIHDEANVNIDDFQRLLYEHCYQFQRATTPVSLFPAAYYAHLACERALAHIDTTKHEEWAKGRPQEMISGKGLSMPPRLIPIHAKTNTHLAMWYI